MRRYGQAIAAFLAAMMWASAMPAQTKVHGADSLFSAPTVKLAWGVLKGKIEADTQVVIRVMNVAGDYRFLRVDGVDPFTKARAVFVEAQPFEKSVDISLVRSRFADHPSTELHFFRDEVAMREKTPALVVYYLGVPDTTPEFAAVSAMNAYLDKMLGIGR